MFVLVMIPSAIDALDLDASKRHVVCGDGRCRALFRGRALGNPRGGPRGAHNDDAGGRCPLCRFQLAPVTSEPARDPNLVEIEPLAGRFARVDLLELAFDALAVLAARRGVRVVRGEGGHPLLELRLGLIIGASFVNNKNKKITKVGWEQSCKK